MLTNIVLIVFSLFFFGIVFAYNNLIKFRNRTKEAWADIDVQLKRRYNLIPNLIETVKGYAKHEKDVFDNVAMARAKAMGVSDFGKKEEAEAELTKTLKTLFAVRIFLNFKRSLEIQKIRFRQQEDSIIQMSEILILR